MARKPRIHYPGASYHVIGRGNQGQMIFHDDADSRALPVAVEGIPNRRVRASHSVHTAGEKLISSAPQPEPFKFEFDPGKFTEKEKSRKQP